MGGGGGRGGRGGEDEGETPRALLAWCYVCATRLGGESIWGGGGGEDCGGRVILDGLVLCAAGICDRAVGFGINQNFMRVANLFFMFGG